MSFRNRLFSLLVLLIPAMACGQTVGLRLHRFGTMEKGYILFAPLNNHTTYLVDRCGKKAHEWVSRFQPGLSAYFLPDGTLLRTGADTENATYNNTGGFGGYIEKLDWDGTVLWQCKISDSFQCAHHDICPMPNGDILLVAWERKSDTVAKAYGRKSSLMSSMLWSEKVMQIRPKGTSGYDVIWEWHVWDHLVQDNDKNAPNYAMVNEHPELININYTLNNQAASDWLHMNGISYNEKLDQIMLSAHNFSEIWIIDHSTTSAQAAAHRGGRQNKGGDLLYRWGNPAAYNRGSSLDQKLFEQHDATWIPDGLRYAGKIMVFNNGLGRPGNYSSIDIISPPVTNTGSYKFDLPYLPKTQAWIYKDTANFFSPLISGVQMLPNGNMLICSGIPGDFFEIDSMKNKVWEYRNPVSNKGPVMQGRTGGSVFRCAFIPKGFSGFDGKILIAGNPIELNPPAYDCYIPSDVSKPVISMKGPNIDSVEVYHAYMDKGASAKSDFSGVALATSGTFYRMFPDGKPTQLGSFDIVYTGTDSMGLADSVRRLVKVVDRTAPVIILNGDSTTHICRWATYHDAGYSVKDNYWSEADIELDTIYFTANTKTISTQKPGTYTLRYRAKDASGNIGYSPYRHVVVDQAGTAECKTGITHNAYAAGSLKIYPNPSSGIINIHSDLPFESNIHFTISNALGQIISSLDYTGLSSDYVSFDLSGQSGGLYFINVSGVGFTLTKQLLLLK